MTVLEEESSSGEQRARLVIFLKYLAIRLQLSSSNPSNQERPYTPSSVKTTQNNRELHQSLLVTYASRVIISSPYLASPCKCLPKLDDRLRNNNAFHPTLTNSIHNDKITAGGKLSAFNRRVVRLNCFKRAHQQKQK